MDKLDIAGRLKALRSALSITQKKLSEGLYCSQAKVSDYESGRLSISNSDLLTIANIYNVNLNWLVTGEGGMFKEARARGEGGERELLRLPVVADIAAGTGIEAFDVEPEEYLSVDPALIPYPGPYYTFKVRGDSMDPYIIANDYAVVTRSWHDLNINGRIVAVRTIDGITLKRFVINKRKRYMLLMPLNPLFPVMEYDEYAPDYTVVGLLVLVIRKFT